MIERLYRAGADVFRLNFTHGTHADHAERIAIIRAMEEKVGRPIGILADVQGPKLRVGRFQGGRVQLQTGQPFRLDLNPTPGNVSRVQAAASRDHPGGADRHLPAARRRQAAAARDAGRASDHLDTEVVVGGPLSDRKGVNVPDVALPIPALTVKDREDLDFVLPLGIDYIGLASSSAPRTSPRPRRSPPAAPSLWSRWRSRRRSRTSTPSWR